MYIYLFTLYTPNEVKHIEMKNNNPIFFCCILFLYFSVKTGLFIFCISNSLMPALLQLPSYLYSALGRKQFHSFIQLSVTVNMLNAKITVSADSA